MKAIDRIKEEWLSLEELASLFGVDVRRLRDMRSKGELLIPHCKLSSKGYYYHVEDVLEYMNNQKTIQYSESEKDG